MLSLAAICLALAMASHAAAQGTPSSPQTPKPPPPAAGAPPAGAPAGAAPAAGADSDDKPPMTKEEIEQIVAPLALYPDSLLAQIFMASTYPLEVVEAERWQKANASLKGDALTAELEKKTWDASVKSLVNFPDILAMMSEKLDMTVKLGDAFIEQQKDVMDAVQTLRGKAKAQGNLESNQQQTVTVQPAGTGGSQTQTIIVESASPEVVYVPSYNPSVVYGAWPYPAYPPYPYYPPGYVASAAVSFGVGLAVGAAWGYAWGGCNWGHGDVDIDCNRNTNINTNIDRSKAKTELQNRGAGDRNGKGSFKHDSSHRQGAPYRDSKTAQKFGGQSAGQAKQSRDAYRGRAEAGRQDISRGGADQFKGAGGGNRATTNPAGGAGNRGGGAGAGGGAARPSTADRGGSSSAFGGSNRSGSSARQDSSRGNASRSSSGTSRSSGSRSSGGGSRGGGGGSRGGGGGGRGGGGGGRR
jgi:hypothetical protein